MRTTCILSLLLHATHIPPEFLLVTEPNRQLARGGRYQGVLGLLLTCPWIQCWWKPALYAAWPLLYAPRPSRGSHKLQITFWLQTGSLGLVTGSIWHGPHQSSSQEVPTHTYPVAGFRPHQSMLQLASQTVHPNGYLDRLGCILLHSNLSTEVGLGILIVSQSEGHSTHRQVNINQDGTTTGGLT